MLYLPFLFFLETYYFFNPIPGMLLQLLALVTWELKFSPHYLFF